MRSYKLNKDDDKPRLVFKGSINATFATREQAEKFLALEIVKYNDHTLERQWK